MARTRPRPLVAGNWKMNGLQASVAELKKILAGASKLADRVEILVCPPATLLAAFAAAARGSLVVVGGQDCHAEACGAHTGDLSAEMLKDAGASAVIIGHSERRQNHAESDSDVQVKTQAAWRAGLLPIVCIGETKEERDAGATLSRIERQIDESLPEALKGDLVLAYEPVWAIGSGQTPTPSDVAQVHALIRDRLQARYGVGGEGTRILYGGSVKPSNAKELMAVENVDGALVGGACLQADEFLAIAGVYG
jgi:triosephosphate isomerase (TIM)